MLKIGAMLNKDVIDQMGKSKKWKHGKSGQQLTYVHQQCWMPSRCDENSAAEEEFQYRLFKQTLEKVKWKNMAPHIQFLGNQCPLMFG